MPLPACAQKTVGSLEAPVLLLTALLLATHSGVDSTLQVLAVTLKLLVCLEVRDRIVD